MSIVNYLCDLVDSIIDQICQRTPSIPTSIRVFCKALYDKNKDAHQSQKMMAKYIIEEWLAKVAFKDMVLHGLLKTYSINTKKNNANRNIKLMGIVLNKLFKLDSRPYDEEVLQPFNRLFE